MNTIVYTNNTTNDAVYVGGEIGVYYMDNGTGSFSTFNTNLPNTNIKDLEIYYPTLKLRAATYGRGTWESSLNVTSVNISATAGANGTISPSGTVSVITGTSQTFTITPNPCYSIATVLVNGVNNPAAVISGTYTFTNVTTPQTISATFVATNPFVIATSCTPPAAPSNLGNFNMGPTKVVLGTINNITTGSSVSNGNQVHYDYTSICLSTNLNIASNPQSITLRCDSNPQKFSVWIDYNNDGTFTTDELVVINQTLQIATDTTFSFSIPTSGVILDTALRMRVIGDWVNSSTTPCGQRSYGQVEDYQVTIIGATTYPITASSGTGGTITPAGITNVSNGANKTYTITPNSCYSIATVLVDGVNNPAVVSSGTYTFSNVTAPHTISATFNSLTPEAPTGTASQLFCNSAIVANLTATGPGTIKWYATSNGVSALSGSTALVSGNHYYASQTVSGCESTNRLDVTVTPSRTSNFATIPAICAGTTAPTLALTSPNGVPGTWSPATISNTTSGSYVFTPTSSCDTGQTLSVTVTPSRTSNFATIPTICAGTTAPTLALTSPNGVSGTWSPATISNTTSGSYVFTPTSSCDTGQTLSVTVTPSPVDPTGIATQNFCLGETVSLISVNGTGIIWYTEANGGTVVSGNTAIISGTTYYASQTISDCESTTRLAVTMTIGGCLGTNNFNSSEFNYFPNPVNDILSMSYSQVLTSVKITNVLGQVILTQSINATETQLDLSQLPTGTYLVEIVAGRASKTIKVLKK